PARRCWNSRLCWTLPAPARRRNPRRVRHRVAAVTAAAALVGALAPGCAPPPPPPTNAAGPARPIDMRTPAGLRAQQTLDMLNSDWPIGPGGGATLATAAIIHAVE